MILQTIWQGCDSALAAPSSSIWPASSCAPTRRVSRGPCPNSASTSRTPTATRPPRSPSSTRPCSVSLDACGDRPRAAPAGLGRTPASARPVHGPRRRARGRVRGGPAPRPGHLPRHRVVPVPLRGGDGPQRLGGPRRGRRGPPAPPAAVRANPPRSGPRGSGRLHGGRSGPGSPGGPPGDTAGNRSGRHGLGVRPRPEEDPGGSGGHGSGERAGRPARGGRHSPRRGQAFRKAGRVGTAPDAGDPEHGLGAALPTATTIAAHILAVTTVSRNETQGGNTAAPWPPWPRPSPWPGGRAVPTNSRQAGG